MISRAEELIATASPTQQDLTDAFWQACHGGQRRMAEPFWPSAPIDQTSSLISLSGWNSTHERISAE